LPIPRKAPANCRECQFNLNCRASFAVMIEVGVLCDYPMSDEG
jgi:hypothetical protein